MQRPAPAVKPPSPANVQNATQPSAPGAQEGGMNVFGILLTILLGFFFIVGSASIGV